MKSFSRTARVHTFLSSCLALLLLTGQAFGESHLCAKKVKVKNGAVTFSKGLTKRSSACTRREVEVFSLTPQGTLDLTKEVDGIASGLDADSIDGLDSSTFATVIDLTTVQADLATVQSSTTSLDTRVDTTETSIASLGATDTSLDTRLDAAETSITTHSSSIATTQSDLAVLDAEVAPGPNIIFVGAGAGYETLAEAVTYVSGQSRSSDQRWTILLSPGVHTISSTITIPSYTTIAGRGVFESVLRGSVATGTVATSAILVVSTGSIVKDLAIENTATSNSPIGIYFPTITVSDESDLHGFDNIIDHVRVTITGVGGVGHTGAYITNSNVLIKNSSFRSGNSGTTNYPLFISSTARVSLMDSYVMSRDTAVACTSGNCTGIFKQQNGQLDVINSDIYGYTRALITSGTVNYIKNSYVRCPSTCINLNGTGNLSLYSTTFDGTTAVSNGGTGTAVCVASSYLNGTLLNSSCS